MPRNTAMGAKRSAAAIAAFLFFLGALYLLQSVTHSHFGDTDRYYHLGLSKLMSERSILWLNTFPQADDIGWGRYFPDKEFLFHVLTKFGFDLGGEPGVSFAVLLAAAGCGLVLFLFSAGILPAPLALLVACSALFCHSFVFRLLVIRPHVLALFFFLLLQLALFKRLRFLTALSAAGYVLAYHGFYLVLICFALFGALSFLEKEASSRKEALQLCAIGVLGLVVGLAANPYFPSQLLQGIQIMKIPILVNGAMRDVNFGMELYPLGAPGWLKFYLFPLAILFFAAANRQTSLSFRYFSATALLFGLLSFQTVRAGEYFVPLAGLLFALVLESIRKNRNGGRHALLLAGAVAFVQVGMLLNVARTEAGFVPDKELYDSTRAAVAAIPPGPAKVFNCDWDLAPFLFHQRPDLRFVDLLDPTFLYFAKPALHAERQALKLGRRADPRQALRAAFDSQYVLCRNKEFSAQLAGDPAFQQLYPRGGPSEVYLFRVSEQEFPEFVRDFAVEPLSLESAAAARSFVPGLAMGNAVPLHLDGKQLASPLPQHSGLSCAHLRAAPAELRRLAGARYLGLGGGEAIRAWRNGKLLFASGRAYARARSVQALVKLESAWKAGDRLDLLVCSGPGASYWSVSLSLWGEAALAQACAWKREFLVEPQSGGGEEAQFSTELETCAGTMAGAAVPRDLKP